MPAPDARRRRLPAAAALLAAALLAASPPAPHASAAAGQAASGSPVGGAERDAAFERIRLRQRDVAAFRAAVVQTKRHPLLKSEAVNEGTLLFGKPNRLRWELDKPERTVIVLDGKTMTSYFPDRKEAVRRNLGDDLASRAAVDFLSSGMNISLPDLEKRFLVDLYREGGELVLTLTPRSKWLSKAIASISIHSREDEAVPRRIVIVGKRGDRTETTLSRVDINPVLAADAFALRLSPDVRVTEPGGAAAGRDDGP